MTPAKSMSRETRETIGSLIFCQLLADDFMELNHLMYQEKRYDPLRRAVP